MASKQCPRCGLFNVDTAELCDCGYRFTAGQTGATFRRKLPVSDLWTAATFVFAAVAFFGFFLMLSATSERPAFMGLTMLLVAVPPLIVLGTRWLLNRTVENISGDRAKRQK